MSEATTRACYYYPVAGVQFWREFRDRAGETEPGAEKGCGNFASETVRDEGQEVGVRYEVLL
jgi:hypothetical protein